MRFGVTILTECLIAIIMTLLTKDIFITTVVTFLLTLIVYNVWDEFFNMIEEDK